MLEDDRRRAGPRTPVDFAITLTRHRGNPIPGQAIDLGNGGMRIQTARPLAIDELLRFELAVRPGIVVTGRARVLREHARATYALRFELLSARTRASLSELVGARLHDGHGPSHSGGSLLARLPPRPA
jgi:hypothetical protein